MLVFENHKNAKLCFIDITLLGAVHKRRPQSGERGLPMRTSTLLVQKTSDFSKFMVCPHGQEGGVIFRDFLRRPLWKTPYGGWLSYLIHFVSSLENKLCCFVSIQPTEIIYDKSCF